MFRFAKCVLALVFATFAPAPLSAQAYPSDWQAALAGGSARLQLLALQTARPDGMADYVAQLQRHLGLSLPDGAGYIAHSLALSPVLEYDSNINGGTPGETITLGGFQFTLSPASRAKAGLVAGVAPSASLRFALGQGTVVEATANVSIARALDHDLTRRSYGLRLCGGQHLGGRDWLDICAGRRGAQRALSGNDENHASLAFARQFASRFGYHEVAVRLERVDNGIFAKSSLDFGMTHAAAQMGVLDWRIEIGEQIKGQHTRLAGLTLSVTRPVWGAQSTMFASAAQEGGADFFGTARWDEAYRIGIARALTPKASVTVSLEDRRSNLHNYAGRTIGFGVQMAF